MWQIVYEKLRYSVMETFLAMTIFRREFKLRFAVLFSLMLVLKIFHWLATERVNFVRV